MRCICVAPGHFALRGRGKFSLQKESISATMPLTAGPPDLCPRISGSLQILNATVASDFQMPARIFRSSSALRDTHLGSGQKESVSEEALRWKSSVFRHGGYAAWILLAV